MAMQHNYYPHSAGHDQRVRQIAERLRQDVRRGIESRDPLRAYHAAMKQQQRPEVNERPLRFPDLPYQIDDSAANPTQDGFPDYVAGRIKATATEKLRQEAANDPGGPAAQRVERIDFHAARAARYRQPLHDGDPLPRSSSTATVEGRVVMHTPIGAEAAEAAVALAGRYAVEPNGKNGTRYFAYGPQGLMSGESPLNDLAVHAAFDEAGYSEIHRPSHEDGSTIAYGANLADIAAYARFDMTPPEPYPEMPAHVGAAAMNGA